MLLLASLVTDGRTNCYLNNGDDDIDDDVDDDDDDGDDNDDDDDDDDGEPCHRWLDELLPGDDDDEEEEDDGDDDDDDDDDEEEEGDLDDDDDTAAPLGRTQRLVQTRTPRQDFFKMFTYVFSQYNIFKIYHHQPPHHHNHLACSSSSSNSSSSCSHYGCWCSSSPNQRNVALPPHSWITKMNIFCCPWTFEPLCNHA